MVDSLLGGSTLNYVGHRECVRKESLAARRANMYAELGELDRQKELAGGQDRKYFRCIKSIYNIISINWCINCAIYYNTI